MKLNKSFLGEGTPSPSKATFNDINNEKHDSDYLTVPKEKNATISIVNEENNKSLENSSAFINPIENKLYSPNHSQFLGEALLDNSFAQRRKSPIEKFGKVSH